MMDTGAICSFAMNSEMLNDQELLSKISMTKFIFDFNVEHRRLNFALTLQLDNLDSDSFSMASGVIESDTIEDIMSINTSVVPF